MRRVFGLLFVLPMAVASSALTGGLTLALFGLPRTPACPPCLDRVDLAGACSAPPDLRELPDLSCSSAGQFCNSPGQVCCAGLACVGGACADVSARWSR